MINTRTKTTTSQKSHIDGPDVVNCVVNTTKPNRTSKKRLPSESWTRVILLIADFFFKNKNGLCSYVFLFFFYQSLGWPYIQIVWFFIVCTLRIVTIYPNKWMGIRIIRRYTLRGYAYAESISHVYVDVYYRTHLENKNHKSEDVQDKKNCLDNDFGIQFITSRVPWTVSTESMCYG